MSNNDMNKSEMLYKTVLDIQIANKEALERETRELLSKISTARAEQAQLMLENLSLKITGYDFDHRMHLRLKEINHDLKGPLIKQKEILMKLQHQSFDAEKNEKFKKGIEDPIKLIGQTKKKLINGGVLQKDANKYEQISANYKREENLVKEKHLNKLANIKKASSEIQLLTKSLQKARKDQEYQGLTFRRMIDDKKQLLELRKSRSATLSTRYNSLQSLKKDLQERLENAKLQVPIQKSEK